MTRINTIDVKILADQHLMAEYRELPMVHGSLKKTLRSKSGFVLDKVSKKYTLNTGHVYFFFNKKKFLSERFNQLVEELRFRGYDVKPENRVIDWSVFDTVPQVEWQPDSEARRVNWERVAFRLAEKPHLYRWTKRDKFTDPQLF